MGNVFGYCRVSTTRQQEDGESLGVQERTITGYAMMKGLEVEQFYIEGGVSGSVPLGERPEGAKLLAALEPGSIVIVAKMDRIFRSALDALNMLAEFKRRGVSLHMIDLGGDVTNGISKLMFTILSAVAEAERDRIRDRIAEVKADQARRGRFLGGSVPFGYQVGSDGALVPVPELQEHVRAMVEMSAAGASLRRIAAAMAQRGVKISHEGVGAVLKRAEPG